MSSVFVYAGKTVGRIRLPRTLKLRDAREVAWINFAVFSPRTRRNSFSIFWTSSSSGVLMALSFFGQYSGNGPCLYCPNRCFDNRRASPYQPSQASGRRDSNPRPLEPHKETGVFGTIWQGVAQPGTTRHHELESICGRGFAGDEGAAQAGTGRHTIFSPGLPPGLPPRFTSICQEVGTSSSMRCNEAERSNSPSALLTRSGAGRVARKRLRNNQRPGAWRLAARSGQGFLNLLVPCYGTEGCGAFLADRRRECDSPVLSEERMDAVWKTAGVLRAG
jgi:hypothetical protein